MFLKFFALCVCFPLLACCADDFDTLREQAQQASAAHDLSTACQFYERALVIRPEWAEGWWYLGNLRFVSGQFTPAEEALHHVTDLRPDLAEGWGMRGMAAMQSHSYVTALEFMTKSVALPFQTAPAMQSVILTNRAFLLSRTGKFDDALEALRSFLTTEPDAELANALGIAALRRKWMPADVPPSDRPLTEAAGRVEYELLMHAAEAERSAAALAVQYSGKPGVHYLYGMALFPAQMDQAASEFARELAVDPANAAAESMLAYTRFAQRRDLDAALTIARHAAAQEPDNPGFAYVAGMLADSTGDTGAAVRALTLAAHSKPDNLEYHIALSRVLDEAGHFSEAAAQRQQALALKFEHAN